MDSRKPYSDTLIKIYDAAYARNAWSSALEACRQVTSAKHTLLYAVPMVGEITFSTQTGSPTLRPLASQFEEYNRRFATPENTGYDDVGSNFMHRADVGKPILDTDIWDIEFLKARPEVQFNIGFGVFRKMYVNLSDDPLLSSGVMFWYDKNDETIPDIDIKTAALLAPHLAKATDIARWADNLRTKYSRVLSVLDKIRLGICITENRGDIILRNHVAEELFSRRDGIWLNRANRLTTRYPEITASISSAISKVTKTSHGENNANSVEITVPRLSAGNSLLVIASPLRDSDMELEQNLNGCLLTIVDTDNIGDMRLDAFGDAYGFTPMEKKSADLLISGLTTPEIGEELGIATNTAKAHIKSVFGKTNSNNRVNFVWKAVQFSPQVI